MTARVDLSDRDRPAADGKTFKKPRRPFEKERLDAELKLVGEYGLRNKRELWRVQMVLSKIRNAARTLLTLEEKDPKRIFEGQALMRRMYKYGLLNETQDKLDYVLALQPNDFLERRLQTIVFKQGLAKSIHHARVLIRQKHIRWVGTCTWLDLPWRPHSHIVAHAHAYAASASRLWTFRPSWSASTARSTWTSR